MRALGTDPIFSNLIVKKFDRRLHVRLRAASVKYGKSIKKISIEAITLWLREEKRKEKEKRETNSKPQTTLSPAEAARVVNEIARDRLSKKAVT